MSRENGPVREGWSSGPWLIFFPLSSLSGRTSTASGHLRYQPKAGRNYPLPDRRETPILRATLFSYRFAVINLDDPGRGGGWSVATNGVVRRGFLLVEWKSQLDLTFEGGPGLMYTVGEFEWIVLFIAIMANKGGSSLSSPSALDFSRQFPWTAGSSGYD